MASSVRADGSVHQGILERKVRLQAKRIELLEQNLAFMENATIWFVQYTLDSVSWPACKKTIKMRIGEAENPLHDRDGMG